jgi:hypothetical protein
MRSTLLASCVAGIFAIIAAGCAHDRSSNCAPCAAARAARNSHGVDDPNIQQVAYVPPPGIPCYYCVYIEEQCSNGCWYDPNFEQCVNDCIAAYNECIKTCK